MRKSLLSFILTALLMALFCPVVSASNLETTSNDYFTMVDEKNNVVQTTGLMVSVGDIYIAADNSRYKVVEVIGRFAKCQYQGIEQMPRVSYDKVSQTFIFDKSLPVAMTGKKLTVAVYHTHDDESYIPQDGTDSKLGNGGIYDVGQALVTKLKAEGFNVAYSQAKHDPHDVNAYNRSRKTAVSLLKKGPDALIDVHRDSGPANTYQADVKGKSTTKVKLVVGRQNPNMKTNMEFAKNIKAVMDKKTPGLSNGIFIAKGDYNQDLSPRAMLIEVGTEKNSKKDAEEGVTLFAEALPSILGLTNAKTATKTTSGTTNTAGNQTTPAKKPMTQNSQGSGTVIMIILLVVAVAAGGYFLLNRNVGPK